MYLVTDTQFEAKLDRTLIADTTSVFMAALTDASLEMALDRTGLDPAVDAFLTAESLSLVTLAVPATTAEIRLDSALTTLCSPLVDTLPTDLADTPATNDDSVLMCASSTTLMLATRASSSL
jgi:hypothetical protein